MAKLAIDNGMQVSSSLLIMHPTIHRLCMHRDVMLRCVLAFGQMIKETCYKFQEDPPPGLLEKWCE